MEFVIAEAKLIYLLRAAGKTKFFLPLGYMESDLPELKADIPQMAMRTSPVMRAATAFGTKFDQKNRFRGCKQRCPGFAPWVCGTDGGRYN